MRSRITRIEEKLRRGQYRQLLASISELKVRIIRILDMFSFLENRIFRFVCLNLLNRLPEHMKQTYVTYFRSHTHISLSLN